MEEHELERFYSIYPWVEDPFSEEGRRRFESVRAVMARLLQHPWVRDVVVLRDAVRVLDVCGGTGIAGVAMAKELARRGKSVELTVVDLRGSALKKAREFSMHELGWGARTLLLDARELHRSGVEADIALLWGLTTSHFSPWDLLRVYAGLAHVLTEYGVAVVEEADRHFTIFMRMGYRWVLPEHASGKRVVLTVHSRHDPLTGYTYRVALDLLRGEAVEHRVYFWDIAGSAALAWVFFQDIDFVEGDSPYRGYVVARGPRRSVSPGDIVQGSPSILRKALGQPS